MTPPNPRTPDEFLLVAQWWANEADQGRESTANSRWYAANMRAAAERRMRDNVTIRPWTEGYDIPVPREAP